MAHSEEEALKPISRRPTYPFEEEATSEVATPEEGILKLAENTTFDDEAEETVFWDSFTKYQVQHGEFKYFMHYLADNLPTPSSVQTADQIARRYYEKTGYYLLRWLMVNDKFLNLFNETKQGGNDKGDPARGFLETALARKNQYFISSLLRVASAERNLTVDIADILSTPCAKGQNSLHLATYHGLACAAQMVEHCQINDLLKKDNEGNTPLHLAMKQDRKKDWKNLRLGGGGYGSNTALPRVPPNSNREQGTAKKPSDPQSGRADQTAEATFFDPHDMYLRMKSKIMKSPEDQEISFMAKLLTQVNGLGRSPYQLRLGTNMDEHKARTSTDDKDPNVMELKFRKNMKKDIFKYVTDISEVRTALYGTEGQEKELFLDMTDFSRPSLNFQDYISDLTDSLELSDEEEDILSAPKLAGDAERQDARGPPRMAPQATADPSNTPTAGARDQPRPLTQPRANMKSQVMAPPSRPMAPQRPVAAQDIIPADKDPSLDRDVIGFEDTLFYVCLPDMNLFKEPPQSEIRRLFKWLQIGGVKTIRHLSIPDSTTNPMSDILIHDYITKRFSIEKFEWRKLDFNLDILTVDTKNHFTELELYSSGNWSVLYHWASDKGLMALKKLQKVAIHIVQPHPMTYKKAQTQHSMLSEKYRKDFEVRLGKLNPHFECTIEVNHKWNYPVQRSPQSKEPYVPNLQLLDQLGPCHNLLQGLRQPNVSDPRQDRPSRARAQREQTLPQRRPTGVDIDEGVYHRRLRELTMPPSPDNPDSRIKVAILDNGADRVRTSIRGQIAKGTSYVTGGPPGSAEGRILPWWMASDPHGTQMAHLVAKANPFCRLYIARVGKGRKDILAKHAAEAIEWAIKQRVDIISISWVMKKDHLELRKAIKNAVATADANGEPTRSTLVFCSTADEGVYSGTVYPASYPGVVNVAATDQYGHMKPASANGVDILVPGENIVADGPSYMEHTITSSVSGSSVATATAAGIASLALLLLKTYNPSRPGEGGSGNLKRFYTRDGILGVFDKMNASVGGAVPANLFSDDKKKLAEAWKHEHFISRDSSNGLP